MNRYIVNIKSPDYRKNLEMIGKVGQPTSLHTFLIVTTDQSIDVIRALDGVVDVEPETFDKPFTVNVQKSPDSWFLPVASNTWPDYYYNRTGDGVVIYIMDSGVRFDHQEFAGRDVATIYSHDDREWGDVVGADHGTMCASCAAGNWHGIAKKAIIRSARYNWSSIEGIKALDTIFADFLSHDKPAVLSMSFGSESNIYDRVFSQLAEAGLVLVAAAGNYDDAQPMFPARRTDVIAVGAVDRNLQPSVWGGGQASNYGPLVDLWAGGSSGVAASAVSSTAVQAASGTSAACPLVAGAVALILQDQQKPTTYQQVVGLKNQLLANTRKDQVKYTKDDPKYGDTPNRLLFTMADVADLPPPSPIVDNKRRGRKSTALAVVLAILIMVGLFVVFA